MKEYNPSQPNEVGVKFVELVYALKDGFQVMEDMPEFIALSTALAGAADEIQGDTDAAIFDALSGASGKMARLRQDVAVAPA